MYSTTKLPFVPRLFLSNTNMAEIEHVFDVGKDLSDDLNSVLDKKFWR